MSLVCIRLDNSIGSTLQKNKMIDMFGYAFHFVCAFVFNLKLEKPHVRFRFHICLYDFSAKLELFKCFSLLLFALCDIYLNDLAISISN